MDNSVALFVRYKMFTRLLIVIVGVLCGCCVARLFVLVIWCVYLGVIWVLLGVLRLIVLCAGCILGDLVGCLCR